MAMGCLSLGCMTITPENDLFDPVVSCRTDTTLRGMGRGKPHQSEHVGSLVYWIHNSEKIIIRM